MSEAESPKELLAQLAEIRQRLAEAEELIQAIRRGEVDSLVISGPQGEDVYPLVHTLRQQLQFQQALMDAIPTPVFYKNLEGVCLNCNEAFTTMHGRTKAETIGKNSRELFPPDLEAVYREKDTELLAQSGTLEFESDAMFADGKLHPVITRKTLFYQPDGSIGGIIGVVTDITERKEMEAEHERLAAIVTGSEDAIIGKTLEGVITDWNPAAERLYGYPAAKIKGKSIQELVPPERHAEMAKILEGVGQGRGVEHLSTVRRRQDGTLVEVSLTVSPIKDTGGQVIGASSIARDISKLVRQERQLRDSEERYRLLVEQIPAVVYKGYADWSVDLFDDKIEAFTGYPKADFDSRRLRWNDLIVPEDLPAAKAKFVKALHGNKSFVREYRIRRRNGEIIWVQGRSRIFLDANGRITNVIGVLFDITARRRSEEERCLHEARISSLLRISQYSYSSIQDLLDYALKEAIDLTSSKLGYICFYEEATQQFTLNTWSREVMQECTIVNPPAIYHLEKTGIWGEAVRQAKPIMVNDFQTPHPLKKGYPPGHAQLYKYLSIPVFSQGRIVAVVAVANKATDYDEADVRQLTLMMDAIWKMVDRHKAAAELEAAAKQWQATFDAISDGICLVDRDQQMRQCNQAMLDLAGKPLADLLGCSCQEALFGPEASPGNYPVPAMFQSQQRESLIVPRNGSWLQISADPIFDKAGEVSGAVQIIADITERQQAQNKINELNSLFKAIAEINEGLIRVKTEPDLFKNTCSSLTKVPKIKSAWISLLQPESPEIKVVAHAGSEPGNLATLNITRDNSAWSQGLSGEAIQTRRPVMWQDMETEPQVSWQQEAVKQGYRSCISLPLFQEKNVIGVLQACSEKPNAFGAEELEFLAQVAGDIAVGVKSLRLEQELIASLIQLQVVLQQAVEAIGSLAELRDPYTGGHQHRVTKLACALAEEMGLETNRVEGLKVAGSLHDLGKITVPAEILNRPGRLSQIEMEIIRAHAEAGYEILKKISFPWPVAEIVRQHHERLNGSGYPRGLNGEDILLEARILAVADVVEAMGSHRPYRAGLGIDKALEEITKNKGILYEPGVVDACIILCTKKGFRFEAGY